MLTIVRNLTWAFDATIFDTFVADGDPGNVPTNHTGWTIRSQIRTRVGNKLVANLNVTFPVPTAGTVAIRHEREFTRSLAIGDYWWSIVATDPAGDDHVYVEPELIAVRDHPTDPANATYDFIPGGGGAVMHTHVISDVTGLQAALNNKAPLTHTHSVFDVTGLQAVLDGKAPLAHTHTIADVLGLQTILNDLSEGGGGGSTTYAGLTDAATVDLPTVNTPLASALSGKETAGAAAAAQAFAIQRANHTGTQAQSTIINLVSDLAGKASLAGNNAFTAQQEFADSSTWIYTATSRANHLSSLGAGTTGSELFGAATAAAARTTLGLSLPIAVASGGTGTTNGSITGTGALTLASAAASNINLTPGTTGFIDIAKASSAGIRESILRATVSDSANDGFFISNGTNTDGAFAPAFGGVSNSSAVRWGIQFCGFTSTANDASDSSSFGLIDLCGFRSTSSTDPFNGTLSDVANRKLLTVRSVTGTKVEVAASGAMKLNATTASTSTTTGALVVSGGVGIAGNINAGGSIAATGTVRTGGYTFATLPTPTQGMRTFITDGAALPVYMANAAGGGSTVTPVFYNGTNWINA